MRLTNKLKDEYLKKIKDCIYEMTGVHFPDGTVYTFKNVNSTIGICLGTDDAIQPRYVASTCASSPAFYYPSNDNSKFRHHPAYYLNEKEWKNMVAIVKDDNVIQPLKEWNDMVNNNYDYNQKIKKNKQELAELALEFDGEITFKEIKREYPGLYVNYHKTKLAFHQWANTENTRYWSRPKFQIKIKPVRDANFVDDLVYNKKEFEKKMSEVDY